MQARPSAAKVMESYLLDHQGISSRSFMCICTWNPAKEVSWGLNPTSAYPTLTCDHISCLAGGRASCVTYLPKYTHRHMWICGAEVLTASPCSWSNYHSLAEKSQLGSGVKAGFETRNSDPCLICGLHESQVETGALMDLEDRNSDCFTDVAPVSKAVSARTRSRGLIDPHFTDEEDKCQRG